MSSDDLKVQITDSLDRIRGGTHSEADLDQLRRALVSGSITVTDGDRSVAVSGDVAQSVIVAGDGNVVSNVFYILEGNSAEVVRRLLPSPGRADEVRAALEGAGKEFVAQLNVAAHFRDEHDNQYAIYLDDDLYVHRTATEEQILNEVQRFIDRDQVRGKWISVVGSAGRGKSSLLWFLYQRLTAEDCAVVVPFQAQLLGHHAGLEIRESVRRVLSGIPSGRRVVVLIDTLDLLVGINDRELSQTLNGLRAVGCLLITASRQQEAEQLYSLLNRDRQVELPRYNDEEFHTITKRYIDKAYPTWGAAQREHQFGKITNLLEQRRNARELDFEPLILRMIFEAYAPDDIPQDINTQKVYRRFWEERVLRDRHQPVDQQSLREQTCRLLARLVAFGDEPGHSDTLPVSKLRAAWSRECGSEFPPTMLHNLVSSGVLQWATGRQAVRFFHQTFLEYTVAYDIRCEESPAERERRIELLLKDVADNELFRAPALKQFAIQDYWDEQRVWRQIVRRLRAIGNPLSAQLLLEIVGKIDETDFCCSVCEDWIGADGRTFGAVIGETVRHYPQKRIPLALRLLRHFLDTDQQLSIYALCRDSFAIPVPMAVLEFLQRHLDTARKGNRDVRTFYKDALCAAFQHGADGALDVLADLFVSLEPGQQEGMMANIAAAVTAESAVQVACFLGEKIYPLLSDSERYSKVWKGFTELFLKVHELSPTVAADRLRVILDLGKWRQKSRQAQFIGRLIGRMLADEAMVRRALTDLFSPDHIERLAAAELLYEAPDQYSVLILDQVFAVESLPTSRKDFLPPLFRVVSGRRDAPPEKVISFLERWGCSTGVGDPLREILGNLAAEAPTLSKQWLLGKLSVGERNHFVFFRYLAQARPEVFTPDELAEVFCTAAATSNENLRLFAAVIGCFAAVDEQLTESFFHDIFRRRDSHCHQSAIASLQFCLASYPTLVLRQIEVVFALAAKTGRLAYLQQLFIFVKHFPQQHGNALLLCLDRLSQDPFFASIRDDALLIEFVVTVKVVVGENPRLALDISRRLPSDIGSVAKAQAALYMNICHKCDDDEILAEVLNCFADLLQIEGLYGSHIRNAIGNALPLLDRKLGGRKVVEKVLSICQRIGHQRSLEDLMRAAVRVPSLTDADISALLNLNLPESACGVLVQKRKSWVS